MDETLRALVFKVDSADERPWGWVGLVASARGLRLLSLPAGAYEQAVRYVRKHYADIVLAPDDSFLNQVATQIRSYLNGEERQFMVDIDLRGYTPFEQAVWAIAQRIPYGETRTYGWIAGQTGGGPGSAQAVGMALGNNPLPLIIPCHRVIGSDGSLHGFAGGLDMKARLLALENQQLPLLFG